MMPMISVIDLHKHFDKGLVKALNGVCLEIPKGEVCSITGPSGCGKSTLLNLIGALDRPTHGSIRVDGQSLSRNLSLARYRSRQVGFVFQFHNLIPNLTLVENVELPAYAVTGMSRSLARERAMTLLSEVGLEKRAGFLPTRVSGGERQRAAVARALINTPGILLADEPTGSVDSETAAFIMAAILNRSRKQAMTVLVVTHDMSIAGMADRIFKMKDGCLMDI